MAKITLEGREKIEEKIRDLNEKLKAVRKEKQTAYELTGDTWHDNPYFNKMEADERAVSAEIAELMNLLEHAEIIDNETRDQDKVAIGSIFRCECTYPGDDPEIMLLEIVGLGESDIESGRINYESVVAKNIMGLRCGEEASFDTPGGTVTYKIIKFYPDRETAEADE